MRIEIRRGPNTHVVIVSYETHGDRFESAYERSKFFKGLYGWEQVVKGYRYRRPGLLNDIPHMKIADSVFMVALENMQRIREYFRQWQEKVEWDVVEVMLEREKFLRDLCRQRGVGPSEKSNIESDEESEGVDNG